MQVGACAARSPAIVLAALSICALSRPASARERLVVLVVAGSDRALSDNLTEVAISTLAERRDRDLVGLRELRGRAAALVPDDDYAACFARAACLASIGAAARAERAVIGTVQRDARGFTLDVALADARNGAVLARASRASGTDVAALISAVRAGVSALLETEAAPPAVPPPRAELELRPAGGKAGSVELALSRHGEPPPARSRAAWPAYVGLGATALAAVSFSAAAVRGSIASAKPGGATRAQVQADVERRDQYATQANILLIAGSVLTAVGAAAFVQWWRGDRGHAP